MKICRKCNENKDDSEFFVNRRNSDGLHSYCKPCKKAMRKRTPPKEKVAGTPLHIKWNSIKDRCRNPKNWAYPRYGGRGIDICDEWYQSFDAFKHYMEALPRGEGKDSIDRIDNNKGYEPGNVRWADMTEQANNRGNNIVIEYDGREQTASQWAQEFGLPAATVSMRIKRGWSPMQALTTPIRGYSK